MAWKVTEEPGIEPITLDEAKAHLKVELEVQDDDDTIGGLITVAREQTEIYCRRALITQTITLKDDHFPGTRDFYGFGAFGYGLNAEAAFWYRAGIIRLPNPPTQSIVSVKYIDRDGVEQTIDPAEYQLDEFSEPARLAPAPNKTWPM